jgi:tRNA (guanine-N7-)-methyltransferase
MTRNEQHPCDASPMQGRILYGRRRGRPLRRGRRDLIDTLLPQLSFALPGRGLLDPATLFPKPPVEVWLEIGFGGGEHLAVQADTHRETGFIGCEPFINGVASLLAKIKKEDLTNIRIFPDDGRALLECLAESSLGRVFILFPDPWPKKRHAKRRLISPQIVDVLAHVMKNNAELRLASDDPKYIRWMLEHVRRHGAFQWLAQGPADWWQRTPDWPATRYEAKSLRAGRSCAYLRFRRLPRLPLQRVEGHR